MHIITVFCIYKYYVYHIYTYVIYIMHSIYIKDSIHNKYYTHIRILYILRIVKI